MTGHMGLELTRNVGASKNLCVGLIEGRPPREHVERKGGLAPLPKGPRHLEARPTGSQQNGISRKSNKKYFQKKLIIC